MSNLDASRGEVTTRHSSGFLVWATLVVVVIVTALTLSIIVTSPLGQAWLAEKLGITLATSSAAPNTTNTAAGQSLNDSASFDQFMTLFLAVAAGGIAYMASAMGMRRLETYDDKISALQTEVQLRLTERAEKIDKRIEEFRLEIRNERGSLETKSDQLRISLNQFIEKTVEQQRKEVRDSVSEAVERQYREVTDQIDLTVAASEDRLAQAAAGATDEVRKLGEKLEERFGYLVEAKVADRLLMDLPSIGEVHIKVTQAFALRKNEEAREMVRAVLMNRGPSGALKSSGDSTDWFNLGSQLGSQDEFDLGLRISLAGLEQEKTIFVEGGIGLDNVIIIDGEKSGLGIGDAKRAPNGETLGIPNVNLLAHALKYAQKIGSRTVARTLVEIAARIPVELRNWRYYQFICDYHNENDNETEFFELVDEFRARMPFEERTVSIEMEWYEKRQQFQEYMDAGEKWLAGQGYSPGSAVLLRLARHAYDLGDYEADLRYTLKGLEGSATAQPNATIGGILYYRANAYDAMCVRALQTDPLDTREALNFYESAVRLYRSKLITENRVFQKSATERCETLWLLLENAGINPPPLDQQGSGNSDSGGDGDDDVDGQRVMLLTSKMIQSFTVDDEGLKSAGLAAFRNLSGPEQLLGRMALEQARDHDDLPDEARQAAAEIIRRLGDD